MRHGCTHDTLIRHGARDRMTTDRPLVSIVTPAYNEEEYIKYNLKSVAAQTYGRIEHVVIDDGSSDRTTEILEDFEGEHALRWHSQSNQGQAETLNRAFAAAKGDIVVWLNADDILVTTDAIASLVDYFQSNPSIDVAYGRRATLDANNKIRNVRIPIPQFTVDRLRRWCFGAFIFFRQEVVMKHNLDPEYQYALDYEFFLRLADQGYEFGYVDETILGYRVHDDTKSLDSPERMRQESYEAQRAYGQQFGLRYDVMRTYDRLLHNLMKLYGVAVILSLYANSDELTLPETIEPPLSLLRTHARTFLLRTQ